MKDYTKDRSIPLPIASLLNAAQGDTQNPVIDSVGYYAMQLGAADAEIKKLNERLLEIYRLVPPTPADGIDLMDKTKVQIFDAVRTSIYGRR